MSAITLTSIVAPSTGLTVTGGPVRGINELVEYKIASPQPSTPSMYENEVLWGTSPVTQSGFSWLSPSNWSSVSTSTGGGSIFTPGANGLGVYTIVWGYALTSGAVDLYINKNVTASVNGSTTSAYNSNNMKALTSTTVPNSGAVTATILIDKPTDYIAFGWYNNSSNTAALPMSTNRNYLRISKK